MFESGTGYLGSVDLAQGRFEPLTFCPGYLRGLRPVGHFDVIELSKPRHDRSFQGLPFDGNLADRDARRAVASWPVDCACSAAALSGWATGRGAGTVGRHSWADASRPPARLRQDRAWPDARPPSFPGCRMAPRAASLPASHGAGGSSPRRRARQGGWKSAPSRPAPARASQRSPRGSGGASGRRRPSGPTSTTPGSRSRSASAPAGLAAPCRRDA
jgi:hypothetical protein